MSAEAGYSPPPSWVVCSYAAAVRNDIRLSARECGTRIWKRDNFGDSDTILCRNCYDWRYTRCCRCGTLLRWATACYEDSDDLRERAYCDPCFARLSPAGVIHPYSHKPAPIFYGDGPRFFGVELEVDCGGESPENAGELLAVGNQDAEHIYIKHDGSLQNGFEIVTHPMSLDYHLHRMPWAQLCRKAVSLGYRSHMTSTCGLHVHVNRSSFGETMEAQDAAIARLLYLFEQNWEQILKFSRRTPEQAARWAARYGCEGPPQELLEYAKKSCGQQRYNCINLLPKETVEFRIFRGTLKANTIRASLKFLDCVCDLAVEHTDGAGMQLAWADFSSAVSTDPPSELTHCLEGNAMLQ